VLGEGVACVVLKRLGDAERDGDRIYAVIKGIAGGQRRRGLGLTAPRPEGQRARSSAPTAEAVSRRHRSAWSRRTAPEPWSATAPSWHLTEVFTEAGAAPGDCALGSVKSQIGHTKCAAGMAGLIKAALAVHTGDPPADGQPERTQPRLGSRDQPVRVPHPRPALVRRGTVCRCQCLRLRRHELPRRARLARGHAPATPRQAWPAELFCFRGATRAAGHEALRKLAVTARTGSWRLRDLAGAVSRESDGLPTPVQVALVARDLTELTTLIDRALEGVHDPAHGLFQPPEPVGQSGKVALLFPGQGSQRPDSLADLFTSFPELHRYLRLDPDSARALFPPTVFDEQQRHTQKLRIRQTDVAQPVLGIGALAAGHLLGRLGIRADMAAGHSYGELAALHTAGAFDETSLLALSHARAAALLAALEGADEGAMAAVTATAEQVRVVLADSRLDEHVVLANYNAPTQVVISGPAPAVDAAAQALAAAGLTVRTLPVACAFHSPQVADAVPRFADSLAGQPISPPAIPVWCHSTALPYPPDPAEVRRIVAEQLAAPVRFAEQIEAMYAAGARTFVEAGPGQVLSGLVRLVLGDRPHVTVACDRGSDGLVGFLSTIAELACAGVPLRAGWLFHGRDVAVPAAEDPDHPMWTVDGQLVRDDNGNCVSGGLQPARKIKELALTGTPDRARTEEDVLCDLMRTSREIVASHRDAVLSYFAARAGRAGQLAALPATGLTFELPALPPLSFLEQEPQSPAEPAAPQSALVAHEPQDVDVRAVVLGVLAERTGYPVDFINLDLDLEADLSIDSIKRTEVAGEIAKRLGLDAGDDARSDELVQARTVGAMLSKLKESGQLELPAAPELPAAELECPPGVAPTRLLTSSTALPDPVPAQPTTLAGSTFLITGDTPVAEHLGELLGRHGAKVRLGKIGLSEADGFGEVDGLILLDGLAAGEEPLLPESFPFLKQVLAGGPRWLLAAVGAGDARTDGVRGLFRAIDREYPQLTVRVVFDDGAVAPELLAGQLLEELLISGTEPVVRRGDGARYAPELVHTPLPTTVEGTPEPAEAGLHRGSVIVLFGGARGITTRFGHAAASAGCTLELVGRTPLPEQPEDEALASAGDSRELRAKLVEIGGRSAAEIDRAVREIQAHREVLATVEELRSFGGEVRYHAVDVRDAGAVHGLLKEIHDRHGRIDGVVHAAGVIEDKLLADKDIDSFARVFETKVHGARAILGALDGLACSPRFVVFYGSISACYGNRGQSDYAAANDALEAVGQRWAAASGNRCLTVHWGPWQPAGSHGGMVSGELARNYAHRGIGLIDPQAGADALLAELAWGDPSLTSVVYTASEW
jgi:acyl transferase domain-containing protein/NAD(P)-dependent dehydrogenase (short-subunit alcohol dehydrogenase family)